MVMKTSEMMVQIACKLVEHHAPDRTTETFQVYQIPKGEKFDHLALLLFKEGKNFAPDHLPEGTLIVEVQVGNRTGYFLDSESAFSFS